MSKSGVYKFRVESYLCDFKGKVTLPVIGNFLLQAATIHANDRGFGYEQASKDNVAWVLSRMSIEMLEYPAYDHDIIVETWVEDVSNFYTQRCFRFLDEGEKATGYARTIWAAINTQTRRPVNIPNWRPALSDYVASGKDCPIEKIAKIPAIDESVMPSTSYSVRYSDIDINKHINSIKYIEHIINIFDLEMFKSNHIKRFEIVYLVEGLFGDNLNLHIQEISPSEYLVDTKKGSDSVCRSRIIWEKH